MIRIVLTLLIVLSVNSLKAQQLDSTTTPNAILDSLYIEEVENDQPSDKVLHAEPLYIDLIRDLGARKGEKEWNYGVGLTDNNRFDEYIALVEYEWAPIDRLGFEIELPFTFYYPNSNGAGTPPPSSKLNSLKLATQWSFFVNEKIATSMAMGYLHEFEFRPFKDYGKQNIFKGNLYNPFFVAAKRWGRNFHTLLLTGPEIEQNFLTQTLTTTMSINTSFHYMIPGTRNFLGVEFNKEVENSGFGMTIRPQMRVSVAENLLIGIVTGIPISRENERFSSFLRIIYEPSHKHK